MTIIDKIISYTNIILSYILGFISSIILIIIGVKIQRKEERKKLLKKELRLFYPLIENLNDDIIYAMYVKSRFNENGSTQFDNIIFNIINGFTEFEHEYKALRNQGLLPELETVHHDLSIQLKGTYNLWKIKSNYLSNELEKFLERVSVCKNLLENFLKK